MQVTETETDGLRRAFKVVITASDINQKLESRLAELGSSVKVPGFRPGKVPVQVLKQRFGRSVLGEVIERAVNDGSAQALNERGLRPATQPKIEITSFEEGKDLEFTMALELLPDIEPIDFKSLKLERLKIEVDDAEVDSALSQLASQRKETRPIEKPRKSMTGDVLVIDFRGEVGGEELPGMAGEDHHLELGSNRFVEGFEDQLVGTEVGDTPKVKVRFPEAYVNEKLAGQEAIFDVTIKEIREAVASPVDEDFAKALGEPSLDVLKDKLRDQIRHDFEQAARAKLKRALLDRLAESHQFTVPEGMVSLEFESIWPHIEQGMKEGNLDADDEGKSEDELKQEYRDIAERRVRLGLLLSEIGRLNNIDVTAEELNRARAMEAQKHPGKEREVFEFFEQNPEAMANLRAPIFENKVVDFIVEMADTEERTISPQQLRDELQAESATAEKTNEKTKAKPKKAAGKKSTRRQGQGAEIGRGWPRFLRAAAFEVLRTGTR